MSTQQQQQSKPSRIPSPDVGGVRAELDRLKARVAALESLVEQTADAVDTNTTIYQDAFQAIEAQTHVTQRILSIIACGGQLHISKSPEGDYRVDFAAYFFEYLFCIHLGQWIRDFCGLDRVMDTDPAPAPEDEDVVVFGD